MQTVQSRKEFTIPTQIQEYFQNTVCALFSSEKSRGPQLCQIIPQRFDVQDVSWLIASLGVCLIMFLEIQL